RRVPGPPARSSAVPHRLGRTAADTARRPDLSDTPAGLADPAARRTDPTPTEIQRGGRAGLLGERAEADPAGPGARVRSGTPGRGGARRGQLPRAGRTRRRALGR